MLYYLTEYQAFLKESFAERSDKYKFYISTKISLISAVNPDKNIYRDISTDETEQYIDDEGNVVKLTKDNTTSEFVCIEAPYTFKLFLQEVESMGIAPRLIADSVLKQWKQLNLQFKDIPTNAEMLRKKREVELYNESKKSSILVKPFIRFQNMVRLELLSKTDSINKKLIDFSCNKGDDLFKWSASKFNKIIAFDIESKNIDNPTDGANKKLEDMKNSDDNSVARWSNGSDVTFIVGDSSKDLFSYDITRLSGQDYNKLIRDKIDEKVKNTFNIATYFNNIEDSFSSRTKINTILSNAKNSLANGGYLLITCLDGERIFNKLKKNNRLVGMMHNKATRKKELIWSINQSNVDLSKDSLPINLTDGFNKQISVTFDNKSQEQSLVHPTLLISLASIHGLKLVPRNELQKSYSSINKAGTFKELFNRLIKTSSDSEIAKLNTDEYRVVKEYSDLHRYFIFKIDNNKIIPNNIFDEREKCIKASKEQVHVNDRYPTIKLSMPTSLDTLLLNTYITQHRALIGKMEKLDLESYDNKFIDGSSKHLSPIVQNIENKSTHPFYAKISDKTYKNTLQYIFNYIKVGIYVRILNSEVIQFVPILNCRTPDSKLVNKDIDFRNIDNESWFLENIYR